MVAKMAVYYKKIWENLPWDLQTPGICIQNAYFIDYWITNTTVVSSKWCYSCIIQNWYIQDGVQDGSRQV